MKIRIFQVDAFAEELFTGNPAAVCPLDNWLPDTTMQRVAMENNLSETAFFVVHERPLHIRWFTPQVEVSLCGHATLASAHVLNKHLGYRENPIRFQSKSGPLSVVVEGDGKYTLDFPQDTLKRVDLTESVQKHFDQRISEAWRGSSDYLFLLDSEQAVRDLNPDLTALTDVDGRGFIVTATGLKTDYVSRCFYPQVGINEDPATGSSHTTLVPFWADKLGKKKFSAAQFSERGGYFETELHEDRTLITGKAVSYLEGIVTL